MGDTVEGFPWGNLVAAFRRIGYLAKRLIFVTPKGEFFVFFEAKLVQSV